MATIISQMTFADYEQEIEILGDLERLRLVLGHLDDEELMQKLSAKRGRTGRNDYPVRAMWNAYLAMKVFGHRSVESFLRELARNAQLRKVCGFKETDYSIYGGRKHLVPTSGAMSRFQSSLMEFSDVAYALFQKSVVKMSELIPSYGKELAGDGKYLDSYCKRKPKEALGEVDLRTETDATYSKKEYHYTDKTGKERTKITTHYGHKAHIICDAVTELPIAFRVTGAGSNEKTEMKDLLHRLPEAIRERASTIVLDRGYDSTELIKSIKEMGIVPVVGIRNMWKGDKTKQYKDTSIVYTFDGRVYYVDDDLSQHNMTYKGYDKHKNCLRYEHMGKIYRICVSYDERVFLPIARDSKKWQRLYNKRTSIERLNGRLDRDYCFEEHFIRGQKKMSLMVCVSLLIMNTMAIGKIQSNMEDIRSLVKMKKPDAA